MFFSSEIRHIHHYGFQRVLNIFLWLKVRQKAENPHFLKRKFSHPKYRFRLQKGVKNQHHESISVLVNRCWPGENWEKTHFFNRTQKILESMGFQLFLEQKINWLWLTVVKSNFCEICGKPTKPRKWILRL